MFELWVMDQIEASGCDHWGQWPRLSGMKLATPWAYGAWNQMGPAYFRGIKEEEMRPKETAYGHCNECGYSGTLAYEDFGIGPYEYWGARGYHRDMHPVCPECEGTDVEVMGFDLDIPDQDEARHGMG